MITPVVNLKSMDTNGRRNVRPRYSQVRGWFLCRSSGHHRNHHKMGHRRLGSNSSFYSSSSSFSSSSVRNCPFRFMPSAFSLCHPFSSPFFLRTVSLHLSNYFVVMTQKLWNPNEISSVLHSNLILSFFYLFPLCCGDACFSKLPTNPHFKKLTLRN